MDAPKVRANNRPLSGQEVMAEEDELALEKILITIPIGDMGYSVPDWKATFELRDYLRRRLSAPTNPRASRELLIELACAGGDVCESAMTLDDFADMLRKAGVEVEGE